jgi:hypothetical protein
MFCSVHILLRHQGLPDVVLLQALKFRTETFVHIDYILQRQGIQNFSAARCSPFHSILFLNMPLLTVWQKSLSSVMTSSSFTYSRKSMHMRDFFPICTYVVCTCTRVFCLCILDCIQALR